MQKRSWRGGGVFYYIKKEEEKKKRKMKRKKYIKVLYTQKQASDEEVENIVKLKASKK